MRNRAYLQEIKRRVGFKNMGIILIVLIIVGGLLFLVGCSQLGQTKSGTKAEYSDISPQEARKRLDSEKGIVLLDVRTKSEHIEKHIPGSILIPVDEIEMEAPGKLPDKNAPIFVYCRNGRRSVKAAEKLVNLGYTDVYNLGGIKNWPYETESGERQ